MHTPDCLGENIRALRRAKGLTQAALAEKLYLTPQNISKWENGQSMPDVSNLCLLADALGVTADCLLGAAGAVDERVMIGIDGGGTKTEFCLFTERGEVLSRELLAGSNPNVYGMEQTLRVLKAGIDALLSHAGRPVGIFAGVAGCGVENNRRPVLSFLKKSYPGAGVEVRGDNLNVIYSTEYYENCLVAVMGTGSVVTAKRGPEVHRLGGWGYLFDRGCSGFDLGREAVTAALADADGVGEHTVLTAMLRERVGGDLFEHINELYALPKEGIAAFATLVFDAFRAGDAVARGIVEGCVARLLHLLRCAAARYDCGKRVILAGGLTKNRDVLLPILTRESDFAFVFPALPPVYGACHYCARLFGAPAEDFFANFETSYAPYR